MVKKTEERKAEQPGNGEERRPNAPAPAHRGAMTPYGGLEPFARFRDEFNRLFERFWLNPREGAGPEAHWGLDVQEEDDSLVVRAEMPGFEPGDIDLQMRDNQLILRARKKAESEEKERGWRQWSRREFYRSVPLPSGVDPDKVEAGYRNGVLTVTVPKTEQSKGRRIEIKG